MNNKIHIKLDPYVNSYTNKSELINLDITFALDKLIFVKLDNRYTLAKIVDVFNNNNFPLEIAKLLVLENNYPDIKVYVLSIDENVDFYYADNTLLNSDLLDILNTTTLHDAKILANDLVANRKRPLY